MSDRYRRPQVAFTGDIRNMTHGAGGTQSDEDSTLSYGDGGDGGDTGGDTGV